jgi:transcriptional regulator of aromatic amino acid metabolism
VLVGNEEDFQLCLGIEGPEAGGKDLAAKIESFKGMIDRAKVAYPAAKVFATTLREVISANAHLWGAIAAVGDEWHVVEPREIVFAEECWPGLMARRFPDNVRGLDKLIVRLLAYLEDREVIRPRDIDAVAPVVKAAGGPWFDQPKPLRLVREAAERDYIIQVCRHTRFNLRAAARALDISPKCLYAKLKQYGITRP